MGPAGRLDLALVHAPVLNRRGETIAATCDEFDFFDLSRLCLTYPVRRFYVVQPVEAQQAMVRRMLAHARSEARDVEARRSFEAARLVSELDDAIAESRREFSEEGRGHCVVATSARAGDGALEFAEARAMIRSEDGVGILLLIGKGWGLAEPAFATADRRLAPIDAGTGFNHLSVRAATAILLDRLLAPDRGVTS